MAITNRIKQSLSPMYLTEDLQLRIRRNKVACLLGGILMPIGSFLDQMLYPDLLWEFITIRTLVVLLLGIIFSLHFTAIGKSHIKWLGVLLVLTLNFSFCTMIYFSEGVLSRYHTVLSLMILSSGILLPWTVKETLIVSIITILLYFSSCLLHGVYIDTIEEWDILLNNSYFILLSGIIASTSSFFNTRARLSDFELRKELDLRNKKLEEMDRLKSRFFANISHELRTPLTLILGPIQDLLQIPVKLGAKVTNLLWIAHDNAVRLLNLVNDLLDIIKLEEGRDNLKLKPLEINIFLGATIDSMRHFAGMNKIDLIKQLYPGPLFVMADSYSLERIFINLLSNAIKFTPEGGSITVSSYRHDGQVDIDITDTGIGISEDDLPLIFDRFHQVDSSSTRKYQGTGLGLALVKELTEKMDGRITVTSQLDAGTTMHISFAHCEEQSETAEPEHLSSEKYFKNANNNLAIFRTSIPDASHFREQKIEAPDGEGPCILIVDDEPDMRRYLASTLAQNYSLKLAVDGREGLEMARKYNPDIVLLDLMLPEIDGLDVCKLLKQDEATRAIKIMLLTARVDEKAKITALEYGADDFLTKPFSKIEVETRIRNLLQTANLEQELRNQNEELKETLAELKQTQSRLIHSEKLNALGNMAAGLLHEINNPLNYSITALQMAKIDPIVRSNEDLNEIFADIDEGMQRIRTITTDLQSFAHPSDVDKKIPFNFNDAVKNALRFTAHEHGEIVIQIDMTEDVEIAGSKGHIVQVLINLLTNSFRAIKEKNKNNYGKIFIRSSCKKGRLHISFRDNGIGMKPEVLSQIFDPFYTTRDVGEGMGLGLSICYTIIQNHGSTLGVESEYNMGTEFSFELPVYGQISIENGTK